jgi:hypothetical protein
MREKDKSSAYVDELYTPAALVPVGKPHPHHLYSFQVGVPHKAPWQLVATGSVHSYLTFW